MDFSSGEVPYNFLLVVLHTISIISLHLWCILGGSLRIWAKSNLFQFIEGQSHFSTSWHSSFWACLNLFNCTVQSIWSLLLQKEQDRRMQCWCVRLLTWVNPRPSLAYKYHNHLNRMLRQIKTQRHNQVRKSPHHKPLNPHYWCHIDSVKSNCNIESMCTKHWVAILIFCFYIW